MRYACGFAVLILLALGCQPNAQPGTGARDTTGAAPRVHPVVDATEGQLFGASRGAQWLTGAEAAERVDTTRRYRLYGLTDTLGTRRGTAPAAPGETCENPEIRIQNLPDPDSDVIGVAGDWNALPRVPTVQDTTQRVYKRAVADYLRQQGIDVEAPTVRLDQVLRVDLEGDGTEEVLIVSNRLRGSVTTALANDYALVLLRTVVDGTVRQRSLEEEYYPEKCVAECAPSSFWIAAVLDANGDGTMEVVTGFRYFEGEGKRIHAVEGEEVEPVLSWRCGV